MLTRSLFPIPNFIMVHWKIYYADGPYVLLYISSRVNRVPFVHQSTSILRTTTILLKNLTQSIRHGESMVLSILSEGKFMSVLWHWLWNSSHDYRVIPSVRPSSLISLPTRWKTFSIGLASGDLGGIGNTFNPMQSRVFLLTLVFCNLFPSCRKRQLWGFLHAWSNEAKCSSTRAMNFTPFMGTV